VDGLRWARWGWGRWASGRLDGRLVERGGARRNTTRPALAVGVGVAALDCMALEGTSYDCGKEKKRLNVWFVLGQYLAEARRGREWMYFPGSPWPRPTSLSFSISGHRFCVKHEGGHWRAWGYWYERLGARSRSLNFLWPNGADLRGSGVVWPTVVERHGTVDCLVKHAKASLDLRSCWSAREESSEKAHAGAWISMNKQFKKETQ
jgi:hypothetical protein